jgi:thioredoxin reductase (NADPH)
LTRRAIAQAQRLGAEFLVPVSVTGLSVDGGYKRVALADGRELVTRAVLAATGMTYREHPAEGIAACTGAGVYYGTARTEAHSCRDGRVVIVGGGNSAGQSAVYLSRFAREVHVVVRRNGLSETMSHYLLDQLAAISNIRIRPRTIVERVEGNGRLERIWLKSLDDESAVIEEVEALFVFIGTRPHSDWLPASVLRNAKGFVLTGHDAAVTDLFPRTWKETREPMPLETSVAGVFAAGDLRAGAMNRVASAVGEGAMAVRLVSDYLART